MKTAVGLFISSMLFGAVIATVYWLTTRDVIGVIFLGMMAVALLIVAIFILVAEREANLAGDHPDVSPKDVAGEDLGTFSLESYWPIIAATGATLALYGVVFLPGLSLAFLIPGAALVLWTARFLVREST